MADGILLDEDTVRERAQALLLVAECVKDEGWGETVAAQLRQAAHDLLGMTVDTIAAKEATRPPGPR